MCSTSEAEELTEIVISFFVDRQLQGLSVLLYECMEAVISYFTDKEWNASCEKIAKSIARRLIVLSIYCFALHQDIVYCIGFLALGVGKIIVLLCCTKAFLAQCSIICLIYVSKWFVDCFLHVLFSFLM